MKKVRKKKEKKVINKLILKTRRKMKKGEEEKLNTERSRSLLPDLSDSRSVRWASQMRLIMTQRNNSNPMERKKKISMVKSSLILNSERKNNHGQ
jgi:hypothetical protein